MTNATSADAADRVAAELAGWPESVQQLLQAKDRQIEALCARLEVLTAQVEWFKRQIFGSKSERHVAESGQMHLGEMMPAAEPVTVPTQQVPAHRRAKPRRDFTDDAQGAPFFDTKQVPVITIEVPNEEAAALAPNQYEVVGHKVSHRLAQRPGSYVVLEYRRAVIKRRDTATLHCPPAPAGVLEGSRADVSFIAGVMVDKFCWHLPLYRQHQRLLASGFRLSRQWLTQLVSQAAALLEPIYDAQLESIRRCRVKAVDETPIKAGRAGRGKMRTAYYWPVYGEHDEVCFAYFASRRHEHVRELLGTEQPEGAVLLSDGYAAYQAWTRKAGVVHAQCWAHMRRNFFDARGAQPQAAETALELIGRVYEVEEQIRARGLTGQAKQQYRAQHAAPRVQAFFAWVDEQQARVGLLPSNKLTQALAYAAERRAALHVYLGDAQVSIDTNHIERALRPIPLGRKNWLFCWSELGAEHTGIVQSLIVTCRLHGIDPYTYFVDVLQRVGRHPAARVAELTPRQWKQHFAAEPLRSDLHARTP